jgi:hypothetical protein
MTKAEYRRAINSGLECLRLFGIQIPAHPTLEQVNIEYERLWQNLGERSIESLIDLPLMTDLEMQACDEDALGTLCAGSVGVFHRPPPLLPACVPDGKHEY